jgi:hypothetical protein
LDLLGLEDQGKWLPFSFLLDTVIAMKQTTDDEDEPTFNCTTIFMENTESYVIDTPFYTFKKIWESYIKEEDDNEDDDRSDLVI